MKKISDYLNWIKRNKIKNNIDSICKEYNIKNYTINEDGTVDVEGKLVTLKGGPEVVIGTYYCRNNNLINFKGFPEYHDKHVDFYGNPIYKLLDKMCLRPLIGERWCKFIYWCNEYDVITDEGKVIPERMEEVYNKLGLEYED